MITIHFSKNSEAICPSEYCEKFLKQNIDYLAKPTQGEQIVMNQAGIRKVVAQKDDYGIVLNAGANWMSPELIKQYHETGLITTSQQGEKYTSKDRSYTVEQFISTGASSSQTNLAKAVLNIAYLAGRLGMILKIDK